MKRIEDFKEFKIEENYLKFIKGGSVCGGARSVSTITKEIGGSEYYEIYCCSGGLYNTTCSLGFRYPIK
jgi:hypothetical protein